jgi:catechol 2,3-dioxygenase-like lactoylglutathione lyase family enzyme
MWKVDHFAFEILDMDRAVRFYTEKLGLKLIERRLNTEGRDYWGCDEYAILELNGGNLELIRLNGNTSRTSDIEPHLKPPYCPHIALITEDMDATLKVIEERDISIVKGPFKIEGWTRWLYICDPDGNQIEIVQWL